MYKAVCWSAVFFVPILLRIYGGDHGTELADMVRSFGFGWLCGIKIGEGLFELIKERV